MLRLTCLLGRLPWGLYAALLVGAYGLGAESPAQADGLNALAEMRAAAEEQADVDPGGSTALRLGTALPSVRPSAVGAETRSAAKEAVRAAVREEVARELRSAERASASGIGRGKGSDKSDKGDKASKADKADNAHDDARGASAQARGAAMSAQEARRNNDVKQRELKANGGGQGPGKKP